jgi:transcriptional regulator with XRE-family HTH domain
MGNPYRVAAPQPTNENVYGVASGRESGILEDGNMENQLQLVAERLRALREIAGITEQTMAQELHIPLATYQQYESGATDIPIGVLYQAANRFGVDLAALLTGEGARLHTYCLVRRDKGVHVERHLGYSYQHLAFNFAHRKAEPFLVTVEPKDADTPVLNTHPGQEFDYVIAGTVKVVIGDHTLILNTGDSLFFDASVPHGLSAEGGAPAQFLAIIL